MLDQETTKSILEGKVITTRAVLYARVSSDDTRREGRNLQGQLEMGREYAHSKNYRIIAELAEDDRGASGAVIDLPQLNRIRDMAARGEFDILIVREIDRLSRNLAKQLIVEEELKRAGVSIEYVLADYEDSPEGRLNKHIRATIAEFEREKIKERLMRGKKNKVKAGNVMVNGRPPYGYKMNEDKTNLVVVEDEAEIVRLIFHWCAWGDEKGNVVSLKGIAKRLTEMGALTAADKKAFYKKDRKRGQWGRSSVWNILTNRAYIGHWEFGKTNGHPIPVEIPAIVDLETWEVAQSRLEQNKRDAKRNRKYHYLLAGRVTCGRCTTRMTGRTMKGGSTRRRKTYQYYSCAAILEGEYVHTCDMPLFRVDKVDKVVWEWLVKITSDPKYLKAKLKEYQDHQDQVNEPLRRELATIDALLTENRSRRKRWLEMYEAGVIELDELKEKQASYEKTIAGLEDRQAELRARLQDTLTDEIIEDILEFAAIIQEELAFMAADFEKKRRFIELLDVQVKLAIEDGQQIAYASVRLGKKRTEKRLSVVSKSAKRPA